jgi:hypothetical protein
LPTSDVKKRRPNSTSISLVVYGPSGVPIESNFTPATLKTQTVNNFLFAVTIFQNGY